MPFYEYVCTHCGAETEVLQKLSDPPETECPVCHAQALSKHISAAGFRLKGGGWYETDFKSEAKRNVAGDAAPAETAVKNEGGGHECGAGCAHKEAPAAKAVADKAAVKPATAPKPATGTKATAES
jgi:putative FmdB family regulatory protein